MSTATYHLPRADNTQALHVSSGRARSRGTERARIPSGEPQRLPCQHDGGHLHGRWMQDAVVFPPGSVRKGDREAQNIQDPDPSGQKQAHQHVAERG